MGSRILTSSLSSSQTISSIMEATESLPTTSTTTTAAAPETEAEELVAFCRSDEVLEAEREGSGAVTGPLVSSVTAFLNCIAPIVHADVATDDQVMVHYMTHARDTHDTTRATRHTQVCGLGLTRRVLGSGAE
jgi:hypothetical protein